MWQTNTRCVGPRCLIQVRDPLNRGYAQSGEQEVAERRQVLKTQPCLLLWDCVEAGGGKLLEERVMITQGYRALCGQWGGFHSGVLSINFR